MKQIKRLQIIVASALLLCAGSAMASAISGAGATFPSAVYKEWAKSYEGKTGVSLSYQNTGSGDGIRQIEAKAVDFGASDMPLTPEELEKHNLVQFPTVAGGVVPVINIVGIEATINSITRDDVIGIAILAVLLEERVPPGKVAAIEQTRKAGLRDEDLGGSPGHQRIDNLRLNLRLIALHIHDHVITQ